MAATYMKSSSISHSFHSGGDCQEKMQRTTRVGITGNLERTQDLALEMVRGPVLPGTSCVTLDNPLCLSDPQFLFLEKCLFYFLSGIM